MHRITLSKKSIILKFITILTGVMRLLCTEQHFYTGEVHVRVVPVLLLVLYCLRKCTSFLSTTYEIPFRISNDNRRRNTDILLIDLIL